MARGPVFTENETLTQRQVQLKHLLKYLITL